VIHARRSGECCNFFVNDLRVEKTAIVQTFADTAKKFLVGDKKILVVIHLPPGSKALVEAVVAACKKAKLHRIFILNSQ